jgi:hypothetical protein
MSLSLRATGIEAVYKEVTKGHLSKKGNKSVGRGRLEEDIPSGKPHGRSKGTPILAGVREKSFMPISRVGCSAATESHSGRLSILARSSESIQPLRRWALDFRLQCSL